MSNLEEYVVFKKTSGAKKSEDVKLEVKQDYLTLTLRSAGALTVNFKSYEEEILRIKDFFESMTDMEPLKMSIGDTGDVEYYFKGTGPLKEESDDVGVLFFTYKVNLQELQ
ncbi:hypothetical protein [Methanobacterium alcaliphilum]|uniref:hypothetical protein n=1 Tax=Methanobacterium alcaliphilum TaxID=392018 RepID=UPI00200AB7DB|nr:hypothetical protein [Methanobacterium alcaliphilum]MCK9152085.1 hypothetical protein [Methanobacterium alcaliphilum]